MEAALNQQALTTARQKNTTCHKSNRRFVSIVDNADTDVKGNKKSRQINGLINKWYLEDMSDNIKAILTNRRENGLFIGAFAPFGYK